MENNLRALFLEVTKRCNAFCDHCTKSLCLIMPLEPSTKSVFLLKLFLFLIGFIVEKIKSIGNIRFDYATHVMQGKTYLREELSKIGVLQLYFFPPFIYVYKYR